MRRIVRLKGIKVVTKSSRQRYVYRRVKGRLIPLPDLPENHPDFPKAYAEAGNAEPTQKLPHGRGTIGVLVVTFLKSREYAARKASTRTVWARRLDKIRIQYGHGLVGDLRPDHIRKALRPLSPGAARSERTIWRALLSFAVEDGWRADNPAASVKTPKYGSTPHHAWTPEEVATFRAYWPTGAPQRQAFEVIYWTGARCINAAALGWQKVEDGVLTFTQEKTSGTAVVPITSAVDDFLEDDQKAILSTLPANLTWILTGNGKPRSVKGLSQFVAKAARDAKLTNCTAHGLRKARATKLAQNGWTPHKIAAWTGHESLSEVAHYTKAVDKRGLVTRTEHDRNSENSSLVVSKNPKKVN